MADIDGLRAKYREIEGERFFKNIFDEEEYKAVKIEPQVIIDVGALAGEYSAYIYDQAKVIYALEPYSKHFEELEENIRDFELDKIKPFKIALSDYNGMGSLVVSVRGGHVLVPDSSSDKTEKVEVRTLATFMKDNSIDHVDILKIDVENAEEQIFSAADFKEVADRINLIIGEHLDGSDSLLQGLGYSVREHGVNKIFKRKYVKTA